MIATRMRISRPSTGTRTRTRTIFLSLAFILEKQVTCPFPQGSYRLLPVSGRRDSG